MGRWANDYAGWNLEQSRALYPRIGSFISASAARPLGPYGFPNDFPIS